MVKKGIAYSLISAVIFGIMPMMTKMLYSSGADFVNTAFYRMALPLVLIYMINRFYFKKDMKLPKEQFKYILIGALLFTANNLSLFNAYNYINSGTATAIFFLNPIIIFVVQSIRYKDKPGTIDVLCILGALIGLILCMDIGELNSIAGVLFALTSAFCFSGYSIIMGRKSIKELEPFKLLFYINFFTSIMIAIYGFVFVDGIRVDYAPLTMLALFVYAIMLSMGGTYLYQRGIAYIGARNASLLCTLEMVVSVLMSLLILKEPVRRVEIFAVFLIFFCAFFLVKNSKN
ncbi:MAG: DMT family transporter [Peptoniphilus sp.]|nr:DMT family transporter [Peptoniphilus sp.]